MPGSPTGGLDARTVRDLYVRGIEVRIIVGRRGTCT
ncbi:hypothetical protein QFZ49_007604 [Streptomyces turgidiscabies]|uniref:Uncharacterized protein n=1 Tax=Streptomyces turgidiscabies TaxID=85558 RepID=A0ABU0S052_9ACTN|nr:hypothetical protein [Streptomyces turgidiscabies]